MICCGGLQMVAFLYIYKKIGSLWLHVATAFVLLYETEGYDF